MDGFINNFRSMQNLVIHIRMAKVQGTKLSNEHVSNKTSVFLNIIVANINVLYKIKCRRIQY